MFIFIKKIKLLCFIVFSPLTQVLLAFNYERIFILLFHRFIVDKYVSLVFIPHTKRKIKVVLSLKIDLLRGEKNAAEIPRA